MLMVMLVIVMMVTMLAMPIADVKDKKVVAQRKAWEEEQLTRFCTTLLTANVLHMSATRYKRIGAMCNILH